MASSPCACKCLVPIAEFGPSVPAAEWAKLHGVKLLRDYLDRPCVSLSDAYRLGERRREAQARAQREFELRVAVDDANKQRQAIFDKAAQDTRASGGAAVRAGLKAVREFDRTLPRDVRSRLDALSTSIEMSF